MSHIVAGRLDDLPSDIRHHLGIFRHTVFVQRLQWEIPGVPPDANSEWDEFDGGRTVHLVALSHGDTVCGCARLMPTTGPYLLRDIFPELTGSSRPPACPSTWELSRFAGSGMRDPRTGTVSGMPLFPYALALASSLGATRVIGVVSRSVARLYRRFGLELRDIATDASLHHPEFIACTIDLTGTTFVKLRCNAEDLFGSITWCAERPPCRPNPSARVDRSGTQTPPRRLERRAQCATPNTVLASTNGAIGSNSPETDITAPTPADNDAGCLPPSPSPAGSPTHTPDHFVRPPH